MTKGREWKLILLFALPIMAANVLQQLYNTVDNIIVGNFAEAAMPGSFAAVSTSAPLTMLFISFAMGLGTGAAVVCAQLFGAQREKELSAAVDTAIILLGIVGCAITVIGWALTPVLLRSVLSVHDPEVLRLATAYMRIYCLGLPFQFLYNSMASVLRGVGDSKASLLFLLITAIANVALDLWFVIGFGWGVEGAAVATVISQVICAAVSYIYLRRKFPLRKGEKHFEALHCRQIVKIGLPTAIQMSIVSFGNVAMMRLVHYFASINAAGNAIVDAFGAGTRIDMFAHVPIAGFQSALASFTGQNIAADKIDRVKRGYYMTLGMALIITAFMCLALYFFAVPILKIFGLAETAISIGTEQVRFYASVFWIFALYMTCGGVLQGAGDTIFQSAATLMALITRVVLAYLGVYAFSWFGYEASWVTVPFGWTVALIITNVRFYTGGWKKKAIAKRAPDGIPPGSGIVEQTTVEVDAE